MAINSYSPIGSNRESQANMVFHQRAVVLLSLLALGIFVGGGYLTAMEIAKGSVNAGWAGMLTLVFISAVAYFLRVSVRQVMGIDSDEHRPR